MTPNADYARRLRERASAAHPDGTQHRTALLTAATALATTNTPAQAHQALTDYQNITNDLRARAQQHINELAPCPTCGTRKATP